VAELAVVRQDAEERIALAAGERDEAAGHAAAQARQAREEAVRARTAETAVQAELERTRADARRLVTQALADAAREREEVRASSQRQAEAVRAELEQVREDAAGLAVVVRDASDSRIAALEEARGELLDVSDRLAGALYATQQPQHGSHRQRAPRPRGSRGGGRTKRDQMIELAGQRCDLASVPLGEVSRLAGSLAAEIGYSPGTARRELVRHVLGLQAVPARNTQEGEGGEAR
jgi:hypothetical protein